MRKTTYQPAPRACDQSGLPRNALGMAVATVAGAGGMIAAPAEAANFTVTNLADDGVGSLRQAIADANGAAGADTITFQAGLSGTITLSTGQLEITDSVTITGPGASNLTVSGNNASRVFYLYSGSALIDVTLSGMRVSGGADSIGAGIINFDENLTLDGMTISGNAATGDGGGLWNDGVEGVLTIRNSTISGNTAGDDGGGMYVEDTGGLLTIANTTISGNTATGAGGGIYFYDPDANVAITGSSISGNTAGTLGGGVYLYSFDNGGLTIDSTTVSGNTATSGGGMFLYSIDTEPLTIENATVSGNQATTGDGGGIFFYETSAGGTLRHTTIASNSAPTGNGGGLWFENDGITLGHTIVGDNTGSSSPDLAGPGTVTVANSLIETPGSATITNGGGNVMNMDPQLAALANNGGSTLTHLPAAASPAVNAGDAAFAPPPALDQRGNPRVAAGRIDIGAVELTLSTLAFAQATATVAEEAGTIDLQVVRSPGDGAASVSFASAAGSALAGSDYTTTAGTLNWPAGDLAPKLITVPILNDAAPEPTEQFTVALSAPAGAVLGAPDLSTVSITDTDVAASSLGLAVTTASVDEAAGMVTLQVNRTGGSSGAASVAFATAPGTAQPGSDYTTTTGTLNWADGDAAPKSITVPIIDNTLPEPAETFTVTLSNATGATLGVNAVATITITDQDVAIPVPASSTVGKIALAMGLVLLGWLSLGRRQLLQLLLPMLLGVALLGSSHDAQADADRRQAERVAGVYAGSTSSGTQTTVRLADGRQFSVATSQLKVRDTRRKVASRATDLAAIPAGTPVTVKTKFNADGSVRKLVVRVYATATEATREAQD